MEGRYRRSNVQDKFHDEYRELFGDAPETIIHESSEVGTESAFNFNPHHDNFGFGKANYPPAYPQTTIDSN